MNKELREDLEHLIMCKDKSITQDLRDDVKMTLDYIDELEKENKEFAKTIVAQDIILKALEKNIHKLQDRINKAIKKLNSAVDHYEDLATDWALKCAIKILRGEDNEN